MKNFKFQNQGTSHDLFIVASSSKGNCVIFDNVMIDIGVSYKQIDFLLKTIDFIFISHRHQDHVKLNTLKKILKGWPNKIIYTNPDVIDFLKENGIESNQIKEFTNLNYLKRGKTYKWNKLELSHSVKNIGFACMCEHINGKVTCHLHATDTKALPPTHGLKFDTMYIEVNWFEKYFYNNIEKLKAAGQEHAINWHTKEHLNEMQAYPYILSSTYEHALILEAHQSEHNRPQNNDLIISRTMIENYLKNNKGD